MAFTGYWNIFLAWTNIVTYLLKGLLRTNMRCLTVYWPLGVAVWPAVDLHWQKSRHSAFFYFSASVLDHGHSADWRFKMEYSCLSIDEAVWVKWLIRVLVHREVFDSKLIERFLLPYGQTLKKKWLKKKTLHHPDSWYLCKRMWRLGKC